MVSEVSLTSLGMTLGNLKSLRTVDLNLDKYKSLLNTIIMKGMMELQIKH